MLRHNIGALQVVDAKEILISIITLRDIELAGRKTSNLLVKDLMTKDLITNYENTPLGVITDLMIKKRIERIPIVKGKRKLVGLITQSTIIRSLNKLLK